MIRHLIDEDVPAHVEELGREALARMSSLARALPAGGRPAPAASACCCWSSSRDEATAAAVAAECLRRGVFVRQTQGSGIRVFPALTITREELDEGLDGARGVDRRGRGRLTAGEAGRATWRR